MRKKISDQNKKSNREIKIIIKNQTEILELKNTGNEMKKKKIGLGI